MSVRELVPKHLFAPAEARGDSDNAFGTQQAAIAYADGQITRREPSSYYGFLYVEHGGQCAGYRPCKFHVFINSANNVVVNTRKKWTSWQKELLKVTGDVPFQTTPVNASGQPKVARRSRSTTARRRRPASEESASEESASEESDSDGDSDEIERLKQGLAEQKEKYRNVRENFRRKLKQELDEQKKEFEKKFEKKLNKKLDEQKKELKERVREGYEVLQVKLKNCMDKKSDQSDLALENKKLRQKIRKLLTVFKTLKDKVDASVKRM